MAANMTTVEKNVSNPINPETHQELTFIDLGTHLRLDLPEILILETKKLSKTEVETSIRRGIDEAMKKGIPIICQAVLYNFEDKTYGLPDILIRSDYINKLVNLDRRVRDGCALIRGSIYCSAPTVCGLSR